jgi:hypothetical protein
MILAFPYHDPAGTCNDALRRHLARLQTVFADICLGASPPTLEHNAAFIAELRAADCLIAENSPETSIGDHSRSALALAVKRAEPTRAEPGTAGPAGAEPGTARPAGAEPGTARPARAEPGTARPAIAFLFLDRFLYALETEHKEPFLEDLERYQAQACMVFERTPAAWATHPANYKEVEGMTTRLGELLFGRTVDWCPCALILSTPISRAIVQQSNVHTYAVWAEWLLLAAQQGATIASTEVDWLAWEDPFWEHVDAQELKRAQERDPHQIVKRIQMHAPIALLMTEPRFRDVKICTCRPQRS